MVFLILAGVLSLLTGFTFLAGKEKIEALDKKLNKSLNKVLVETDAFFIKNRQGTGICLILLAILFFFIAYWIKVRAPVNMVKILVG